MLITLAVNTLGGLVARVFEIQTFLVVYDSLRKVN